jgi:hypothetical protein
MKYVWIMIAIVTAADPHLELRRAGDPRRDLALLSRPRRAGTGAGLGLMLQGGAEEYASTAPWIAIFPGLAIALTVFGFSFSATRCATPSTPSSATASPYNLPTSGSERVRPALPPVQHTQHLHEVSPDPVRH